MNTKLVTARIRIKNWAAIIQNRNAFGWSVKDYCALHQLSKDSYYYWLRKVKEIPLVEITQPVPEDNATDPKVMMTLMFRGMQLDIPLSIQRDTLSMIIEAAAHAQ